VESGNYQENLYRNISDHYYGKYARDISLAIYDVGGDQKLS
jgi:hypothetical protein